MVDNTSLILTLTVTPFLYHMSSTHSQPQNSWQLYPPPLEKRLCVIYKMCKKLWNCGILKIRGIRYCTESGKTSTPTCWKIPLSKIHPYFDSTSSRYMDTEFDTITTPSGTWTDLVNSQFLRHDGKLRWPTSWLASQTQENPKTPNTTPYCTGASPISW